MLMNIHGQDEKVQAEFEIPSPSYVYKSSHVYKTTLANGIQKSKVWRAHDALHRSCYIETHTWNLYVHVDQSI